MTQPIFTGTIASSLKETLDEIVDDDLTGSESSLICTKWMKKKGMSDHYEDDLEMGGPGLASEMAEGTAIVAGQLQEGFIKRYIARKFGLKLIITEEAMEDSKYPKVIQLSRRLNRSIYKTMDIDNTNILVRAVNASYLGGDGVVLASASHTLPAGGTFSNLMTVAAAPSITALETAISQIKKFPGHDSTPEGAMPKKVVFPTEQWGVWARILGSPNDPEPGNFTAINTIRKTYDLDPVEIKYWTNTTTNWGIITDVDNGLQYRLRRKPRSRSWVENSLEQMVQAITARWANGWTDARGILFVNS